MREIQLTQGKVALVDDADFDWLNQWKWTACQMRSGLWYAGRNATVSPGKRKFLLMHRVISGVDDEREVDHEDGDGLNNRRLNIRVCSQLQNSYNRKHNRNNSSGFKGVRKARGNNWRSTIYVNQKQIHLGVFTSREDAARAYDVAALEHFGEFAKLNYGRS